MFDNIADADELGSRERYEAIAYSVRDVLSQRWLRTEQSYVQQNPKRVYYLSMEFLIGRSLANNVTNLLLDPAVRRLVDDKRLDWLGLLEEEPDAGLGNGGLGRLAACFIDSMATMQIPATGYGLRYEYGIFKQTIEGGWQRERPDCWLRRQDPWEIARPHEAVKIELGCSFEVRGGTLRAVRGEPSTLVGLPFDRPVVGYGGKTINTLRLWAAAAPETLDFQAFSAGEFVSALRVPRPTGALRFRTYKVAKRYDQDISAVCAAFALHLAADGTIRAARVAFGGMAATPKRAAHVEAVLNDAAWNEDTARRAMDALTADYQPLTDMRASSGYRLKVARNLLWRFYLETRDDAPLALCELNAFAFEASAIVAKESP